MRLQSADDTGAIRHARRSRVHAYPQSPSSHIRTVQTPARKVRPEPGALPGEYAPPDRERRSFVEQPLSTPSPSRGVLLLLPIAAITALAARSFYHGVSADGSWLAYVWTGLFAVLFGWILFGFAKATFGFFARVTRTGASEDVTDDGSALPKTAIAMPIYNEDPCRVFAAIESMAESLENTVHGESFELFILSDTQRPDVHAREEELYQEIRRNPAYGGRIFYRRRIKNLRRKAGNIADFCERWGHRYTYLAVVDADSVLTAHALVALVRRMEREPKLGILQAPNTLAGGASLFARLQQFASSVYGPVFATGQRIWCGADDNYYGHNAVIRMAPFIEHCGLPELPGKPPFGGEILSHDFVEAALMRRGGWEVRMADDLDGSFEEAPPTLSDFLDRDRRWCQGNLQHLRLLFANGLRPMSRVHFASGALSYLAAPLWLLFLVTGIAMSEAHSYAYAWAGQNRSLLALSLCLLFIPKIYGLLLLLGNPRRVDAHGGALCAIASVLFETGVSIVMAPIMMLAHTQHIVGIISGRAVGWKPQQRETQSEGAWRHAWRRYWRATLLGIAASVALWFLTPSLVWWMLPVVGSLVFAIPLVALSNQPRWGGRARNAGLLLVPTETEPPRVLRRFTRIRTAA